MSALKICPQCGTEFELDQRFCPKDGSTLKTQGGGGADLVGSIIADRYHVLKKLGEGGMGTVYLAEHVKMGRKSAVKVMNPGMVDDADAISRFNREAANASKISHTNVASVYDFGETTEGLIYLAMEFVEGPALTKVIEEAGALPPIRAADITRQAAEALAVAHDMGIVHRDLKPDNIMLAKNRDGSDCVKVVDFGIAKAANNEAQKVTRTGLVVGTPEYMSPEQLAGDKLDGRSDIYSLGLVAFAMMTGKLPFPGETVQESMIARLTDEPKRLAEMKSDVNWPSAVQAVMDKALQRDFVDRYQSASEFGRDLYKAVSAMPESAATNAFTSVMGRLSTPKKPNAAIPSPAKGTKVVPQTRVNRSTSSKDVPVATYQAAKGRTGLYAGVGAVLVAAAAFAMFKVGGFGAKDAAGTPMQSGGQVGQTATSTMTPMSIANTLDEVKTLLDARSATAETANLALAKLDSIKPLVQSDSNKVEILLRTAEVHFVFSSETANETTKARELKTGCDILRDNEGKAARFGFKQNFSFYLYGDTSRNLPPAC